MTDSIKMTISASIALYETIDKFLYDENKVERKVPFSVKYKLLRDKDIVEKDVLFFNETRNGLIKRYGSEGEGGVYKVLDENVNTYREDVSKLLLTEIDHKFYKLTTDEVLQISNVDVPMENLRLFLACLVDDPDFVSEMNKKIEDPGLLSDKKEEEKVSSES